MTANAIYIKLTAVLSPQIAGGVGLANGEWEKEETI